MTRLAVALLVALLVPSASLAGDDDDAAIGRRLQELLRLHQTDVFGCVQSSHTAAEGEMLIRVFIGENNLATRPEVLKDASGGGALGLCLVAAIKKWDLRSLGGSAGDQVVFPLAFKPDAAPDPVRLLVEHRDQSRGVLIHSGALQGSYYFLLEGTVHESKLQASAGDLIVSPTGDSQRERVIRGKNVATFSIAEGRGKAKLYLGPGGALAIDRLEFEKDASAKDHRHDTSDELLYVVSGKATTTIGDRTSSLAAGDSVTIPKGVPHSMRVDEKLVVLQVYAPAGPEQRFKQKK